MKILVIGATGKIGAAVAEALEARHEVVGASHTRSALTVPRTGRRQWSPPPSGAISSSPTSTPLRAAASGGRWPGRHLSSGRGAARRGRARSARPLHLPRGPPAAGSGAPTPRIDSTRRSSGGRRWSAASRPEGAESVSSAWSSSSRTTNGRTDGASSCPSRWPGSRPLPQPRRWARRSSWRAD